MHTSPSAGDNGWRREGSQPAGFSLALLSVVLVVLLLAFSVAAIVLDQIMLAVMSGTTGVGLAAETGRRTLRAPAAAPTAGTEPTVQ